jgi:flagellar basal-body rod modification protein FlgD
MSSVISLADAASYTKSTGSTSSTTSGSSLSTSDFMSLMVQELKNQDPSSPMSTSDMVNQMAQMSTVTTFEKLNTSFSTLLNLDWIGLSTSMLGKTVTYLNSDGTSTSGSVGSIEYADSAVKLVVGSDKISLKDITGVSEGSS